MTQLELSLKVFNKPNQEYIGKLERGIAAGITLATADKIMFLNWSLGDIKTLKIIEIDFSTYSVPDLKQVFFGCLG